MSSDSAAVARIAELESELSTQGGEITRLEQMLSGGEVDTVALLDELRATRARGEVVPAKLWSGTAVRNTFLNFMQSKGHTFFPASPITGDPTLLFTNSGMVQFKPLFLSRVEKGSAFEGLKKACNR